MTSSPTHLTGVPALQTEGLVGLRGGRRVVDGVSLALPAGQWVAVVGPNGAGKSSLLRLLAGLAPAHQGQVRLLGRPLHDWPARQRAQRLAWMAQEGALEAELSVHSLVALGRLPHQGLLGGGAAAHAGEHDQAVQAALLETEVADLAERRVSSLSGGERQRVLLARALAVGAPVLLLDEPLAHLDAPHQRTLLQGLRLRAAAGHTVVTVLHDLSLALAADRVLLMHQARLCADGAPGDPALQREMHAVFGHSLDIVSLPGPAAGAPRWVALPRL